jgi:hypothetical protein
MKPILFQTEMIRAILEGRKTQTRRIIKPQPEEDIKLIGPEMYNPALADKNGFLYPGPEVFGVYTYDGEFGVKFPYGKVGDVLWVRETWRGIEQETGGFRYEYKATEKINLVDKWKPSIFMPREAARIFLEVTDLRVERVRDISEEDARAEGVSSIMSYKGLWCKINGPGSWDSNPWVWITTFKRIEKLNQ